MSDITTVILAAGNSTRFKASKSKLVYPLCGLPIVSHIFNIAKKISDKNILIVCNEKNKEELKLILNTSKLVVQKKQKGTADAIEHVKKYVKSKNILILFGDTPLVEVKDIRKLISKFNKSKAKASLIAFNTSEPHGYGRLLLNNNYVEEIIEQINLKPEQKKINLCNSGILIANTKLLFDNLDPTEPMPGESAAETSPVVRAAGILRDKKSLKLKTTDVDLSSVVNLTGSNNITGSGTKSRKIIQSLFKYKHDLGKPVHFTSDQTGGAIDRTNGLNLSDVVKFTKGLNLYLAQENEPQDITGTTRTAINDLILKAEDITKLSVDPLGGADDCISNTDASGNNYKKDTTEGGNGLTSLLKGLGGITSEKIIGFALT